jgi:hypothetical protein
MNNPTEEEHCEGITMVYGSMYPPKTEDWHPGLEINWEIQNEENA